jgi:RIO kinase 1
MMRASPDELLENSIEDGSIEDGSIEDGSIEDGSIEDGSIDYVDPGQRRPRRLNPHRLHKPKVEKWAAKASLVERVDPEQGSERLLTLSPSLDATNEERAYLFEQLGQFNQAKLITSVLRRVKGGKEANVYCCAAHPATGLELIAAKVYRPRQFRNLKNDSQYRQGRPVLTAKGQAVDPKDWRLQKAIASKSRKGLQVTQASWVAYEFQTMQKLHTAGADVPEPIRNSEHAILMEYFGDVSMAAPTLHLITLEPDEAPVLFQRLLHNVELMLRQHVIHGDLSAYNVLYVDGDVKIIDLPQIVDPRTNPDARSIFNRDVERLCQYFERFGVRSNPRAIAHDYWKRYVASAASNGASEGKL